MTYRVVFTRAARRHLDALDISVAAAVVELVMGDLAENPHRVCGPPLKPPLGGKHRAKRGPYRVILTIDDDDEQLLTIESVRARADAYR